MAEIVLAIGTSHSPMLNSPAEDFPRHAEVDRTKRPLLDKEGRRKSFDELVAEAAPSIADEITLDVFRERVEKCQAGIRRLADAIDDAKLDVLIVVGDDQREQFFDDNMPSILVYWGETIRNNIMLLPEDAPAFWRKARSQYHEPEVPRDYPVASNLGRHLIDHLIEHEFDVSHATKLGREHGEGHAFGFVHRRLLGKHATPILPVLLNTYFPPNQPRPKRCYELGREIRKAVDSWEDSGRIGIVGSGGLSHFTVDEELDRQVLDACRRKDSQALMTLPINKLNSGSSEIRNWITVAGAAEDLETQWQDYVPCYRSAAGTGTGMAFAIWS